MLRRDGDLEPRTPAAIARSAEITPEDIAHAKETIAKDATPRVKQLLAVPKANGQT